MYKKLEDDDGKVSTAEQELEAECTCTCKAPSEGSDKPQPDTTLATVQVGVYYDING